MLAGAKNSSTYSPARYAFRNRRIVTGSPSAEALPHQLVRAKRCAADRGRDSDPRRLQRDMFGVLAQLSFCGTP